MSKHILSTKFAIMYFYNILSDLQKLFVNVFVLVMLLQEAVKFVQPSLRREGFSSIPNVKWDDVGGLTELKNKIVRGFIQNIKSPEVYEVLF